MQSYFWLCRSLGCHLIYAHVNWQTRRATHLAQFNSIKLLMGDKHISRYLSATIRECVLSSGIFALCGGETRRNSPRCGVKTKHKFAQESNRNCSDNHKKAKRKCSFGKIPCSNKLTYYNIPNIAQTFIYSKCLVLSIFLCSLHILYLFSFYYLSFAYIIYCVVYFETH